MEYLSYLWSYEIFVIFILIRYIYISIYLSICVFWWYSTTRDNNCQNILSQNYILTALKTMEMQIDKVSEWLRRQIRNLLGVARASSNLVVVELIKTFFFISNLNVYQIFQLDNCNTHRLQCSITLKSNFWIQSLSFYNRYSTIVCPFSQSCTC